MGKTNLLHSLKKKKKVFPLRTHLCCVLWQQNKTFSNSVSAFSPFPLTFLHQHFQRHPRQVSHNQWQFDASHNSKPCKNSSSQGLLSLFYTRHEKVEQGHSIPDPIKEGCGTSECSCPMWHRWPALSAMSAGDGRASPTWTWCCFWRTSNSNGLHNLLLREVV